MHICTNTYVYTHVHVGLWMASQEATTLAVVGFAPLVLEREKPRGRAMKRPTPEAENINAKAGTLTLSPDSHLSASLCGCTS